MHQRNNKNAREFQSVIENGAIMHTLSIIANMFKLMWIWFFVFIQIKRKTQQQRNIPITHRQNIYW